ncbi:Glutaredoxin-C8 [Monoraphidium neglectum]|uniref:Glutaredoxin-C8 n=1 Tax=Monoraphidium neglectum TaxID=145388 RepID=A0A0D2LZN7_9CHLO|nr:Glutaredoxin-C8 [Monoraphidium neglectum]KIY96869.1 Glutaredoxin-C8 [Monoraphidium neglectum]|eukprot:XP_013895889.1 Glutaredoxin-C8 [Monoraphidium neglectum]
MAHKVVVYSKTTCPYCTRVKGLLGDLKVDAKVIELNTLDDGPEYQDSLLEVVGRRTVPQVFIGGSHVGGCDDTVAAYNSGKLKELLAGVGYSI